MPSGHVWIVGAGPGDPGLITMAGLRALELADVVVYDALAAPELLASAPATATLINAGKRAGQHELRQEETNALLVERALAGQRVVRLKGGDPFVFGRGGEEALACRAADVPFTIVPGISSAIGAPAYAGIPVTHRGLASNFLVVTASDARESEGGLDWRFAAQADTLLILMGAATLDANMSSLREAGKGPQTPAACVQWGTRGAQQVVVGTVATIAQRAHERGIGSPIVTVVGPVALLANDLEWFGHGPLAGRRIVVTRARTQASELAEKLLALGANVLETPVLRTRALPENLPFADVAGSRWDWIVFTSANGVEAFFESLTVAGRDARALHTTQLAAVGAATARALTRRGLTPDFVPSRATSAALADEIERVRGARIFLPVSSLTDGRLADALRARGGLVEQVAAYETLAEQLDDAQRAEVLAADAITFTSASTARNLANALSDAMPPPTVKLISIGPETSAAVLATFGRVDAEASSPGLDALVTATCEALPWD